MKKITPYFIILVIILIGVYDFWIIAEQGKVESVSATIIRWSHEYPSFTFLLGFTMGHLFWRMKKEDVYGKEK
tara:strand:+ start:17749 stop:17967 length:219 start_codon:yes stop_codon:yes gene_type:complete